MFAGLVDCTIALPLQTSFAAIIFRDPYFHPLLGSLVKLVFLSSALHQLTVFACSSMPYAVGQVQDVGLIFLSAIASAVVQQCSTAGVTPENTMATVLTAVTAATGVVGILLVCTGALKLARLVQYVPLPVMGGYLCFVGYFVLGSGVSLATGLQVGSSLESWAQLANVAALLKLAPALVLVALISLVMARTRSPFALPTLLVAAPAAFYAVLFTTGHTLADARAAGWVSKPQPGDSEWRFWRAWSLYNIHDFPPSNIHWAALPGQLYKLLTLFFIVAFGSSMDIAAIQVGRKEAGGACVWRAHGRAAWRRTCIRQHSPFEC
jgi:SulP family sulfate permease